MFLLPIMTKYLTEVDFGISGTISAYTEAISAFATLGLGIVLMNSFFKNPEKYKEEWRQIYGFLKIWMWFFALIQATLLFFFVPAEAAENKWWIIVLTNFSTVFFGPTALIGSTYFIYTKQSVPVVWRSVLASIITVLTDFILIVYLKWGYMGWYVGTFAGTFFSNATYWFVVNVELGIRPVYSFNKAFIKHSLSISMPTIPHYYTGYLLEGSGRMVMDQSGVSQGEIGKITISQQIGGIFQQGMKGLFDAVQPYIMQNLKDGKEKSIKVIGLSFTAIIFIGAFVLSAWSKEIFSILLSNETLASSYPYFIAYLMALCYRPTYYVVSSYYFYYEKTKQLLLITFTSGIIALIIYVLFMSKYGVWAFLIGHYFACLYYGYSGFFFKGYKNNTKISYPFIMVFVVQLLLTGLAYLLVNHLVWKIIVSCIGLIAIVVLLVRYYKAIKIRRQ